MKIIPDSYHVVIMRSSGGGAPVTVPARWVRRLWIVFMVVLALLLILSLALGITVQRLGRTQAALKARQAEVRELYISLARQNEQLISLKKLVPPASALYLSSLDKPAANTAAVGPLPPAATLPPAQAAAAAPASSTAEPLAPVKPAPALAKLAQAPVQARPAAPQVTPLTPAVSAAPAKPKPAGELVSITDLRREGEQLGLRLNRAGGEIASGYLVAVFSRGGDYASYPAVGLNGAAPRDGRQGLDFNVRNYRLISFKPPLNEWSRLTFFVYDRQGRLKQRLGFSREQIK